MSNARVVIFICVPTLPCILHGVLFKAVLDGVVGKVRDFVMTETSV